MSRMVLGLLRHTVSTIVSTLIKISYLQGDIETILIVVGTIVGVFLLAYCLYVCTKEDDD